MARSLTSSTGSLQLPEPCNLTKQRIFKMAEKYAARHDFLPGDRIEPVVWRLGGSISYLTSLHKVEAEDGSLIVRGRGDFSVYVSAFTGAERDRFTIAHELGHYVLHSNEGERKIRAARFGSSRVEWEANWFAAAFLMPEAEFKRTCERHDRDANLVAAHFLVSPKAAEVRMQALSLAP